MVNIFTAHYNYIIRTSSTSIAWLCCNTSWRNCCQTRSKRFNIDINCHVLLDFLKFIACLNFCQWLIDDSLLHLIVASDHWRKLAVMGTYRLYVNCYGREVACTRRQRKATVYCRWRVQLVTTNLHRFVSLMHSWHWDSLNDLFMVSSLQNQFPYSLDVMVLKTAEEKIFCGLLHASHNTIKFTRL